MPPPGVGPGRSIRWLPRTWRPGFPSSSEGTASDGELIDAARSGRLADPTVLEAQARRLLANPRYKVPSTRFTSLWLRLAGCGEGHPRRLPLPHSAGSWPTRHETELFFHNLVREDRSLPKLYESDYTFVNEWARHYGIDGVHGEHFRWVAYPDGSRRGILAGPAFTRTPRRSIHFLQSAHAPYQQRHGPTLLCPRSPRNANPLHHRRRRRLSRILDFSRCSAR